MSSEDIDYPAVPTTSIHEIEENFLRSCRNGDLGTVKQFLAYRDAKKVHFDISCKGRSKYNGWTPLHLATYFGHLHVCEYLLARNADVNAINENGDTALHKAAFIGREVRVFKVFPPTHKKNNHPTQIISFVEGSGHVITPTQRRRVHYQWRW